MKRFNIVEVIKIVPIVCMAVLGTGTVYAENPVNINGDNFADLVVGVPGEAVGAETGAGAINVIYGDTGGLTHVNNEIWYEDISPASGDSIAGDRYGSALALGDFDGDGYLDTAIGIPDKTFFADVAGLVVVYYGSIEGVSDTRHQTWTQDTDFYNISYFDGYPLVYDIEDHPETFDRFGSSVATGDFNGDGYADLAIGVPGETIDELQSAGAVNIIYGSADGLSGAFNQFFTQDTPNIEGNAEAGDNFGSSLTTGDFNGDGYTDIAVGVQSEAIGVETAAGAVNIIYGSKSGLTSNNNKVVYENLLTVNIDGSQYPLISESYDSFGKAMTSGDFNGDNYADLAINGATQTSIPFVGDQTWGSVNILFGSKNGLSLSSVQVLTQGMQDSNSTEAPNNSFGWALAAGDFDANGKDDIAIGIPGENILTPGDDPFNSYQYDGAVQVFYGSVSGIITEGNWWFHQHSPSITGDAENGDLFGWALTTGDFNDDSYIDLAIGVPEEDIGNTLINAGAVNIIYGSKAGLTSVGDHFFTQDTSGIAGGAESGDLFGSSLASKPPKVYKKEQVILAPIYYLLF